MIETGCPRENEVLDAVATGSFTDELRIHALECSECTELVLVAGFMSRGAEKLGNIGPIPDADYLWWRANLEQRQLRAQRATGIITLVQRIGIVVGGLVAFLLLRGIAPRLVDWLAGLPSAIQTHSPPGSMASPVLVILVSLGLLAAPSVFNLYGTWTRD